MNFLNLLWAYILVFLLSAIPFFEAIAIVPLAIVGGLNPLLVLIIALLGNLLTVYLVVLFIDKIKSWRKRKKEGEKTGEKENKRSKRAQKIWEKYGLPGLAFIGPFFVGSHVTAMMSITLGGTKKSVSFWVTGSLIAWCVFFAVLAHLGFDWFNTGNNGFIADLFSN